MIINELSPDMIKSLHIGIKFYGHKLKLIARSISFKYGVKVSVDVIKSYFNTLSPNDKRFYQDKDSEEKRFILILARQYYFLPETLLDKYHEEYDRDYIRKQDIRLFLTSTFNQIMALVFRQKKYILKDDVYDFVLLFMNWPILVYEDVELRSILQDLFDIADFLLQQNNNRKQRKEQIISKFGDERLQTILESLIYIDKIIDIYMQETKNQIILDEGTINIIVNKKQYKYFEQQISRYFSIINHDPFDLEDKRTHLLRYIIDKPYHYKDNFFNELDEDQSFQIFYNIFIQHINVNCKKNLKLNPFTQKQLYIKVNNLKKLLMDAKSLLLQNQFVSQVCRSILGHRNKQIDKQQLNSILEIYLNYVIF